MQFVSVLYGIAGGSHAFEFFMADTDDRYDNGWSADQKCQLRDRYGNGRPQSLWLLLCSTVYRCLLSSDRQQQPGVADGALEWKTTLVAN
jgi:hypothetical protein